MTRHCEHVARFFVFLDFDGVLNSRAFFDERRDPEADALSADIDPQAVLHLNDLLSAHGKVVVSSTWRYALNEDQLTAVLEEQGFTGRVVGLTPDLRNVPGACRGDEVCAWLLAHGESLGFDPASFRSYIILDDCDAFLPQQQPHLFRADNRIGLTPELCQSAKTFLCRVP